MHNYCSLIFNLYFYNKKNLATTYLPGKVTREYCRHLRAWLLCSEWDQVFPLSNNHQKSIVYFDILYLKHTQKYIEEILVKPFLY